MCELLWSDPQPQVWHFLPLLKLSDKPVVSSMISFRFIVNSCWFARIQPDGPYHIYQKKVFFVVE